jgi:hypothetical protein
MGARLGYTVIVLRPFLLQLRVHRDGVENAAESPEMARFTLRNVPAPGKFCFGCFIKINS